MLFLIDNYDSFTYNIAHAFQQLGKQITVARSDIPGLKQVLHKAEGIIIGPGPGSPSQAGMSLEILKADLPIPILGICLGMQAIAEAFGGKVVRAKKPMHGKLSPLFHNQKGVFAALPKSFQVTRYHSLVVDRDSVPPELEISAQTDDGTVMGLRHREYAVEGVQFHPESILTASGHDLLRNFLAMTAVNAGP